MLILPRFILIGLSLSLTILSFGPAEAKESSWGKISSGRFQALANFGNAAVLDRETGLIWESCPREFATANPTWTEGMHTCWNNDTGQRTGWRLPTIVELRSLGVRDASSNFKLPDSEPFCNLTNGEYWTSTISLLDPNGVVTLASHGVSALNLSKNATARIWCVRGPQ